MNTDVLIDQLGQSQALLHALVDDADDTTYRSQYHADLSPLGWHLGHCVFNECLWLHEKVRGDDSVTGPIADFYTPPRTPKEERGKRLPRKQDLLTWARELNEFNLQFLRNLHPQWRAHPLFENDYLLHFLIQHNAQHYETMLMVLTQKSLAEHPPTDCAHTPLEAADLKRDSIEIPAGHYRIGGERPQAYDNEVPLQKADLGAFAINRQPVTNAEFLGFINDDGYQREEFWQGDAWQWRQQRDIRQPDHWRQDENGNWLGVGIKGSYDLAAAEPVSGISYFEARAFASWASARLPHEYQWEAACRIGALQQTGRVWEWCDNPFHPYQGFKPFPYDEYSKPWFDDHHFSLKGGSLHTRPAIKRASFRNFFEPHKRHIFAGLRLVY